MVNATLPGRFTPGKDTRYSLYRAHVGYRAGLQGAENLAPTWIRSLGRYARSESLYGQVNVKFSVMQ